MEKISFVMEGEEKPVQFYVLEQTRIGGFSYLLVTDRAEGDADAWIMKDISRDGESEAVYEMVEDDDELEAIGSVFAQMMEDVDIL